MAESIIKKTGKRGRAVSSDSTHSLLSINLVSSDTAEQCESQAKAVTAEVKREEELECAVCLQSCVHAVKLPCSHIFCFLCVKGVANQSKRCPMCRQEIPVDYLDNPNLLAKVEEKKLEESIHQWFYEGRNGWWQYEERTSNELEAAYSAQKRTCEVLVAGFLYIIDFDRMIQQRRNDPSRRRRIKRDLSSIPKKGVAGLKIEGAITVEPSDDSSDASTTVEQNTETEECTPDTLGLATADLTQHPIALQSASELAGIQLLHSNYMLRNRSSSVGSHTRILQRSSSHPISIPRPDFDMRHRQLSSQSTQEPLEPDPTTVRDTSESQSYLQLTDQELSQTSEENVTDISNEISNLNLHDTRISPEFYNLDDSSEHYVLPPTDQL